MTVTHIATAAKHRFDLPLSEEGLIGALLIRPSMIGDVADEVQPADIFAPQMARIYAAMLALWGRGILPDTYTVADELRSLDDLEGVGGAAALTTLQAGVPSLDVRGYIQVILDASLRRRVILAARTAQEIASDPAVSAADALDAGREVLANIDVPLSAPSEVEDVETFCAGEDRYDWLVTGLVEKGDRILVVAAEAAGKSMLLRQIAVTCAFGIHPFRSTPIDPMRVLLIDLENPVSLIRRKLRPMVSKARQVRPYADPTMMGVLCKPGGIDVTRRSDARWLAGQLMAAKPDLVVAGPLYKMFQADDKWEQGARAVTSILDDLRTRLGFALVLETHAPQAFGGTRNLRPIGSSLWLRWPEFGLSFAALDGHPEVVRVKTWKSRDERWWPEFLQRGGAWPWTVCADPEGPKGQGTKGQGPAQPPQDNRAEWDQGEF